MVLQSTVFGDNVCSQTSLYYRYSGKVTAENHGVVLAAGAHLSTYTYMNLLDADILRERTCVKEVILTVWAEGQCEICLCRRDGSGQAVIDRCSVTGGGIQNVCLRALPQVFYGKLYFQVDARGQTNIYDACYECSTMPARRVRLGVIICTYKRKEHIDRNITKLLESLFFRKDSVLYGGLRLCVVDNGSELKEVDSENFCVVRNPNTGGSGGFTKGMDLLDREDITNVVLMDDDVSFFMETFYRLYALLSFYKEQFFGDVIAGRMFRLDVPHIQYSACEIWNRGRIGHIGFQCDMTQEENLCAVNECNGEYAGWWFACYPIEYIKNNRPLPFFLHCDDVEFGLRYGKRPVIYNGIQVWHETYEYRQTPLICYYDTRNPLFVNSMYDMFDAEEAYRQWKQTISACHREKDYRTEYMIILGMLDFLKGTDWLYRLDSAKYHERLKRPKHLYRVRNAFLWRIAEKKYNRKYKTKK